MRELYDPRLVEEESEAGASRLRAGTRPAWGPRPPRTVRGCISRPRLAPHAHGHLDSSREERRRCPPASPPTPRGFAPCSAPDLTLRVDSSLTASFTCNET